SHAPKSGKTMVKQFAIVAYIISRNHTLSHVFPIGFLSKGDNEPKTKLEPLYTSILISLNA
ncbi:MAG: hypothetical protein K6D37_10735, partial [Prevotella sp.]|nr:hypothetical protein [Prevotella sp.]